MINALTLGFSVATSRAMTETARASSIADKGRILAKGHEHRNQHWITFYKHFWGTCVK
jgi:hypothetical protein